MPKQSSRNPKFRCNHCKEYHSAPEHMTMYQCATHGYVCAACILERDEEVELKFLDDISRIAVIPDRYSGYCHLAESPDGRENTDTNPSSGIRTFFMRLRNGERKENGPYTGLSIESADSELIDSYLKYKGNLCSKTIRYDWNPEHSQWIEEGAPLPEKAQTKSQKADIKSILLLVDLFEKNILSKDKFIETLREQLGG